MSSNYPIRIRASASTLTAWQNDEEGSWEDNYGKQDHVYVLLGRHKTVIEIRSSQEALTLLRSGKYHGGMSGWDDDRHAFRAAVKRLTAQIKNATGVMWDGTYGYKPS